MTARLSSLLVAPLLGAALLAGCGGGSKSTSQPASTATAPASATTASSATPTTTSTTATTPSAAAVAQGIAACKSAIQSEKVLPAAAKQKLEAVCPNAAKGESAPVRKAAEEVCSSVINNSAVPAVARSQALAACRNFLK